MFESRKNGVVTAYFGLKKKGETTEEMQYLGLQTCFPNSLLFALPSVCAVLGNNVLQST